MLLKLADAKFHLLRLKTRLDTEAKTREKIPDRILLQCAAAAADVERISGYINNRHEKNVGQIAKLTDTSVQEKAERTMKARLVEAKQIQADSEALLNEVRKKLSSDENMDLSAQIRYYLEFPNRNYLHDYQ